MPFVGSKRLEEIENRLSAILERRQSDHRDTMRRFDEVEESCQCCSAPKHDPEIERRVSELEGAVTKQTELLSKIVDRLDAPEKQAETQNHEQPEPKPRRCAHCGHVPVRPGDYGDG